MTKTLMQALLVLGLSAGTVLAQGTPPVRKPLTGIAGKEALLVTVTLKPGEASAAHRHNAHVFVYVLEGSVVMQVKGGKELTLGVGETFYETPEDVHVVSRNASTTAPAKFLAFLVKDEGAPVTVPGQ